MKPFYHLASQILIEKAGYFFFPLWRSWIKLQNFEAADVAHATMGYGTELFDCADRTGVLKVIDAPNSHPWSYKAAWQGECDVWCPGEKIPVPDWMLERMAREIDRADMVLCPSFFVRDSMIQNGVPPEKCFVNPFGVNTNLFTPRTNIPEKPIYISVGTICVRKGFQYLFQAFERVKKEVPEAQLIVVGDYKTDFRMLRARWEGTFTHIPHVTHPVLAGLLQKSSAFVLSSVEEGFARVILEAMASGLPIIATHESGATTLVRDGIEGIIVPARDAGSISDAMIRLGREAELNVAMGRASYEAGGRKNSWQDYGDRLAAEYAIRTAKLKTQRQGK